MVARIHVAVPLHYGCMTTRVSHSANAWSYAHPVGKGGIEELNEHLANVVFRPFIEDFAQEMPPLHALYFEASTLAFPLSTIHHGGELKEAALKVVAEKYREGAADYICGRYSWDKMTEKTAAPLAFAEDMAIMRLPE